MMGLWPTAIPQMRGHNGIKADTFTKFRSEIHLQDHGRVQNMLLILAGLTRAK